MGSWGTARRDAESQNYRAKLRGSFRLCLGGFADFADLLQGAGACTGRFGNLVAGLAFDRLWELPTTGLVLLNLYAQGRQLNERTQRLGPVRGRDRPVLRASAREPERLLSSPKLG